MDWIQAADVAVRVAGGVVAYLAVGVAVSPVMVRLDEWSSRVYWGLPPDVCRKLSREMRGPVVLIWPAFLLSLPLVGIFLGAKSFFLIIGRQFGRFVGFLGWLSEQVWPDRTEE